MLREKDLTLKKTDEMCQAAESTREHVSAMGKDGCTAEETAAAVHVVSRRTEQGRGANSRDRLALAESNRSLRQGTEGESECNECGWKHGRLRQDCPAFGKICLRCGGRNHFARSCRWRRNGERRNAVKSVELSNGSFSNDGEVFMVTRQTKTLSLDQQVTVQVEQGNFIRFQADTGAECNVLPLGVYTRATGDHRLREINRYDRQSALVAYGGATINVCGEVIIRVWRGGKSYRLACKLVDNDTVRPILGRRACIGMGIIRYIDNDRISQPTTEGALVFATDQQRTISQSPLTKEELQERFPSVFADKTGTLAGEHHIRINEHIQPVQHVPRRLPVATREKVQRKLDELEKDGIVEKVTEPTPWISSMVTVVKPNGKLRICLDPKDLNRAVQREKYQLPTIEDVATRLTGAKVFTKLDARNGFWHIKMDKESSRLTTFHTPFGRYCWRRLPFGICSAPEVFQRRMHEVVEGLVGVEVVADDFLVVGYGDTIEQATKNHDENLVAFLRRCDKENLVLNADKLHLRQTSVTFIGHVATDEGLKADQAKVKAIADMPTPTDVAGVHRFLGMVQYLSKFLPHLSDMTKPLRDLLQKETEWCWEESQEMALRKIKDAVCTTPVLRYYSLDEEVTLQCDASQFGLGAVLLQNGQPVAFASRTLTSAETRYAQIEKELLAIVFACEHFYLYVYGRDRVRVHTDHKPLETIVKKPLYSAPKRLQRMLLRLQVFNIEVEYLKGKEMLLADTLSRAPLKVTEYEVSSFEDVNHQLDLPVSDERWEQLKLASKNDPVLRDLQIQIKMGWPQSKRSLADHLTPFFGVRDQLIIQDDLIFRGHQVLVPKSLRRELMEKAHASHAGIGGTLRKARAALYWPRMTAEIQDFVSKCDTCLRHRSNPGREPLQSHDVGARPWAKVAADLALMDDRFILVVSDYFSNFVEVTRLSSSTSFAVIKAMKEIFARFGIPDELVSDNGPQFASSEFKKFADSWSFRHTTSSPGYPQSNGKAEQAVQTVKRIFRKCKETGQSEYLALLEWRNTPSEGMTYSPAERLLGRQCKTMMPATTKSLEPRFTSDKDKEELMKRKEKQKHHYDRRAKTLPQLVAGDSVQLRLPGQAEWTKAVVDEPVAPRSFLVTSTENGRTYRRNRTQLIKLNDQHLRKTSDQQPLDLDLNPQDSSQPALPEEVTLNSESEREIERETDSTESSSQSPEEVQSEGPAENRRRSSRERKPPRWLDDYVQ